MPWLLIVQDCVTQWCGECSGVYVHPDFRKQGLFRLLYNHVKMEAMNSGAGTQYPLRHVRIDCPWLIQHVAWNRVGFPLQVESNLASERDNMHMVPRWWPARSEAFLCANLQHPFVRSAAGGLRLYVDANNKKAQATYKAMGMVSHYTVFEEEFPVSGTLDTLQT